jgi:hypothetical protein
LAYYTVFLAMKNEEKNKIYRPDHLAFLEEKEKEGKIFARGPLADGSGGLVIYIADTFDEVESMVKDDPYVVQGARDYEIKEWKATTVAKMPEQ